MTPNFITLTGIDDRTDLTRLDDLAAQYPIEWGILISADNRDARYPSDQAVLEMLALKGRKAAHLCGGLAVRAAKLRLDEGVPLEAFHRAQINGTATAIPRDRLGQLGREYDVEVILQSRKTDGFPSHESATFLFDPSGGRGIRPETIPPLPDDGRLVGYSGGMGPDTVADYLARIAEVNAGRSAPFWIDMEGALRTNGWFDVDKAARVCEIVYG